jgi:hypothetical protein
VIRTRGQLSAEVRLTRMKVTQDPSSLCSGGMANTHFIKLEYSL